MQVLQGQWDATLSEHSHGFRPRRSAHQAVAQAQQYIAEGKRWVVDLNVEKFFDGVWQGRGGDPPPMPIMSFVPREIYQTVSVA
jgi:hypothetical protein